MNAPTHIDWAVLEDQLDTLMRNIRPPEALPLAKAVRELQRRFGTLNTPTAAPGRVEAAVRQALKDPSRLLRGQLFTLAFTLAQPVAALRGKCVLEREVLAGVLLDQWERAAKDHTLRLLQWRGLFQSYMQAPKGLAQERLGLLLRNTLDAVVRQRKYPPAWLEGLQRHKQLMDVAPCAPYFRELMVGESLLLQDLTEYVTVPPSSWFWHALKTKLLEQIEGMLEPAFRRSIGSFIRLDSLIPLVRDDLAKALLDRYDACADRSVHGPLMEFALAAWDSPQLERNLKWKLCRPSARGMVCGWLAREDLEDFYRLCKGEQQVDERRLEFWLRFQGQMGYTQILLGSGMRNSRDRDVRDFIEKKKGRLGDLTHSTSGNNAILMQIGGWLFVEFSEVGTACRAIRPTADGLSTGKASYSLPRLRGTGEQWTHMPSAGWQEKFLQNLHSKGVLPDDSARTSPARHSPPVAEGTGTRHATSSSLERKLEQMKLRIVDNRAKGGALWAFALPDTPRATLVDLAALGFRYKSTKQAWYLQ